MGYVDAVLADNERILYRTRQHVGMLVRKAGAMLFAFVVFLAIGLAVLIPPRNDAGNEIRFWVGVVALGSLLLPAVAITRVLLTGARGRDLVGQIWRSALITVLILVTALFLMFQPDFRLIGWVAILIAIVPLLFVIQAVAQWFSKQYIITSHRVMEIEGVTDKHVRDSALEKVNDIELDQSLLGRILGYGHVEIITGSDIGVDEFYMIRKPVEFKRRMLNAKENLDTPAARIERGVAPKSEVDLQRSAIPELIAELALLHKEGVLSDEEFESKKKDLLSRL